MPTIKDFLNKYYQKIDNLDLELLISAAIKKPREFVLTHPEHKFTKNQELKTNNFIARRRRGEPLAYILGKKEFYGLEFNVDKNTLIPRPETEQLIELASHNIQHGTWTRLDSRRPLVDARRDKKNKLFIIDVGTGSGNIIISIAKAINNFKFKILNLKFIGIDISSKALNIARQNAKKHKLDKKINFLHGNLLEPIIQNSKFKIQNCLIVANLPYLSSKIYSKVSPGIKDYEPKLALLSDNNGLGHYKKLLKQIKELQTKNQKLQTIIEFSPEQKVQLKKAILTAFPQSYTIFFKDLAGKFRVAQIKL